MRNLTLLFILLSYHLHSLSAQIESAPAPLPKATKPQIADWISQHVVAWDEASKLTVNSDECRLQILRNNKSTIRY